MQNVVVGGSAAEKATCCGPRHLISLCERSEQSSSPLIFLLLFAASTLSGVIVM